MAVKVTRSSAMSDINVTPLVDVMLVLLVIFMVTAPLLETQNQAVNVDLPKVSAERSRVAEDAVVVTVDRGQRIYLNDHPHDLAELRPKLDALFKARANKEIFLRADQSVPYGRVVETMAVIRAAGITKLNMVTDPLESEGGNRRRR
ncbi:MAG: biopolymer transporter ExbD [Candidatus Tectomicrobia bacterium]|nr:biopolymer transporter ExbD [Candidatus Tectomicrobia bacterium]